MAGRDIRVGILGDARDFSRAVSSATGDADRLGRGLRNIGRAAALGAGAVAVAGVAIGKSFVDAAIESQKVTAQTDAVIKSMGNTANVTAEQVAKLSTRLSLKSGIDDELIQSGSNVLLTFANLRNEVGKGNAIFDRANQAALDMSVALGTDMKSASMQVGKALNDPVKGLTALRRSGIQFTQQQEDQIKAMVAVGDTAGAQKVMLGELERQFGGSAAAQATATDQLKVAWGNVQEQLGEKLLPVVEKVATWLADTLPGAIAVTTTWFNDNLRPAIAAVGRWLADDLAPAIAQAWSWFNEHLQPAIRDTAIWIRDNLVPAVAEIIAWIATKFVPAVAAIVDWIGSRLVPVIQTVAAWIKDTLVPAVKDIIEKFGEWIGKAKDVAVKIKDKFDDVVSFVKGLPERISDAASGMWDGIKNAFKSAINWIIRAWNGLEFGIPAFKVGPVGYDGFTLGVPDIPELHMGGMFVAPYGRREGLALLETGERVIRRGGAGGGGNRTVHVTVQIGSQQFGRFIIDELDRVSAMDGSILVRTRAS